METRLPEASYDSQAGSRVVVRQPAEQFPQHYEDLLRKGLHLAYFIIGDREAAVEIVSSAMSKLKTQHCRERKRFFWRDKSLKDKIYRLVRGEGDMFQWLIFLESGNHEKTRERAGLATTRDLVVWYVKHLVQTASSKSAFYVSVGIQRLLYSYNTAEAQRAYERLTEHYNGAEMYRKVKRILMSEIERRFENRIKSRKGLRGERRFEIQENQKHWADLVERSLRAFIPWSTLETCPASGDPGFDASSSLLANGRRDLTQDLLELRRCHVFIDPDCYERLAQRTGLDSPRERLTVPQFMNANTNGHGDSQDSQDKDNFGQEVQGVEDLTDAEASRIMARIDEESALREKASPRFLSILANGEECAKIDVTSRVDRYECEIAEGASLLEIVAEFNGRVLPLATHWIEYTRCDGVVPARATLNLVQGSELSIEIGRIEETEERPRGIALRLKCRRTWSLAALRDSFNVSRPRFYSSARFVLATVMLVTVGWLANSVKSKQEADNLRRELAAEKSARATADDRRFAGLEEQGPYRLVPHDFVRRNTEGAANEVSITLLPHQDVVRLELPVRGGYLAYRAVLKKYFEGEEILTESFLAPRESNQQAVVQFVIPAVAISDRQLYAVDLYAMNDSKGKNKIHRFTFQALKLRR